MNRISIAIVDTLLEEIVDYEEVNLTDMELQEIYKNADRFESKDDIELVINSKLIDFGFTVDDETNLWIR